MKTTKCDKCDTEIRNCNYTKHQQSCDGSGVYKPTLSCKWCSKIFTESDNRPNHTRWCDNNPKKSFYKKTNDGSQMRTPEAIENRKAGIKAAHAAGKYDAANAAQKGKAGHKHTDESKEKIREKALASPHRRLVRSIRSYTKKDGSTVMLDSSWEEILAKRLDELNINWIRPNPIKWVDMLGKNRNYFPDFYLTDFDLYLDPKNRYACKVQADKITCLTAQVKNLIILTTDEQCKNFTLPT